MHPGYEPDQIFLYRDRVDFRKSIDGLAAIVEMELGMNIFSSSLFVFTNRHRDKMKILYWSKNGFCLWCYVPNYLRLPQLFDSGIFKGVFRHPPLTIARQRQA